RQVRCRYGSISSPNKAGEIMRARFITTAVILGALWAGASIPSRADEPASRPAASEPDAGRTFENAPDHLVDGRFMLLRIDCGTGFAASPCDLLVVDLQAGTQHRALADAGLRHEAGDLAFTFDAGLSAQPGDDNYFANLLPDLLLITAN